MFSAIKDMFSTIRIFVINHHRIMRRRVVPDRDPRDTIDDTFVENGARKRKEDGVVEVMTSEKIQYPPSEDGSKLVIQKGDKIAVSNTFPVFVPGF